jgi:hypothetical protein
MSIDRSHHCEVASIVAKPVAGQPDLLHLHVQDDSLRDLGLPGGSVLEAERGRQALNGDLVWVELVRHGSLVHLLRRYAACEGVVTLADPAHREPSIIRQPGEMLVRAVVTTSVR